MANEIIRPDLLPKRASPAPSEAVPSDDGSTVAGVSWLDGVNAAVPVSSQAEAEAGANNSKRMTPLTTKQAIDYQVPPKISAAIGALNLGSASQASVGDFATAAQGSKADSAVQPSITISAGSGLTGGGTLAANRTIALSSTSLASLGKADSAVQPEMLADVAFSGSYNDLSDLPSIPQGTVTSVGVTAPAGMNVAGSPVTSSGTMSLSYAAGYQGYTSAESSKLAGIQAGADKTPTLAAVATSGDYGDLTGRPTLGSLAAKNKVDIADLSATGTPNAGTFLRGDNTWGAVAGAGTVTSVAMTVPTGLSVSGSPITGAGTIAVTYASGYQGYTSTEASKLAGISTGANLTPNAVQSVWNTATSLVEYSITPVKLKDSILFHAPVTSVAGKTGAVTLAKGDVGLGNVDNTSDANKPVSGPQAAALNGKVTKANDTGLGGFTATSKNLGNLGSAVTLSPVDGNIQHGTNTEAVTITAPSVAGVYTIIVELVNSATAGAVTLAGFTKVDGDSFTTTDGDKFQVHIAKTNSAVTATVKGLQ